MPFQDAVAFGMCDIDEGAMLLQSGFCGFQPALSLPLPQGPHAALLVSSYADILVSSYADPLALAHNEEHLTKFEMLLEASLDLGRVPEECIISAAYDPRPAAGEGGESNKGLYGVLDVVPTLRRKGFRGWG